ncbi:nitrate- and nitrite sensing domain-containing protein [Streptomyces spororaveus]|uniref:histidine kinase n=1 Tax=Streptomyces spororaveus TaxID=284039 RepID=A0ABQ3TBJ3_9ACTN|nr:MULTISPECIES: nitrate- and nitrite sensing domain-containing protein [Streptomyces]MCM9081814.1 nitrate- and nitrite sensing domain-containing protein [Streptomyces spororaveus]MCX5303756.1 nitrate- and nitrite sensing domain-containing protein [Streptomyces sp. NBC_00160]GHI77768.1 histidine kinase [Streptomyces spororaveus]
MQKKRSRKNGTAADGPAPAGRRVRVRRRLVVGVAVAGLTVLAAGAPAVVSASRELNDSQRLVTLADQTRQTLTLAHLLGDERDAVVEYAAKGRPGAAKGPVQERIAGTDRQLAEVQAEADEATAQALARVRTVRAEAVDGKGSALAAEQAYAGVIAELLAPGRRLAELTPPRAEAALTTTRPLAPLGQAVEQASATRGLLLAALAVPRGDQPPNAAVVDELTTAAQRARVREQAALDDFARAARPDVRQTLAATVTGPEVKTADDFLKRLTDRPTLTPADRKTDGATVGTALTARIDRMRTVEATLASERASALAALRDDDVTRLEIVIALLGLLFLLAVGFSTAVARSLTRPLSVLRRGAQRLATPEGSVEPVRFTGRNDEFAEVVRHLNAVRDQTVSLHTRIAGLDADRRRIIGRNEVLAAGREALEEELTTLRAGLEEHRRIMSTTSVSLSLRTLGLVERQLAVIEELESKEQDADRLATLFKLDHLATVMRRHNENLLVLAGQEHGHGQGLPVPLVDVMRAAVSEIERYERVELAALPSYTQVAGHAADDISHVLAELLENATTFSPPDVKVKVSGWLQGTGDVVLSVVDEGIGVTEDRLESLNARLSTPEAYDEEPEAEHGLGLGLYVAGRLAARHGVTAELRTPRHGGTEALVVVPAALLPDGPTVSPVHTLAMPGAPELRLPGVIAEANENTLPKRRRGAHAAPEPDMDAAAEADAEAAAEVVAEEPAEPAEAVEPAAVEPVEAAEPEPEPAVAAVPITLAEALAGPAVVTEVPAEPHPVPAEAEPLVDAPATAGLPSADQVFVAGPPAADGPTPEEQLLARVVPDAEPAAPGVPDPAEEIPAAPHTAAPVADVQEAAPETEPHTHAPAEGNWLPRQGSHPADQAEGEGAVTDKGLPRRTPRTVPAKREARADGPPEPPRRVDAEELRRRLGGFYQGAQDGRRVVAAELAQEQGSDQAPDQAFDQGQPRRQGQSKTDRGDTAQEART